MSSSIQTCIFKSPVGDIILGSYKGDLCLADWRYRKMRSQIDSRIKSYLKSDFKETNDEVLKSAQEQLEAYFSGERKSFELPLKFCGTTFQHKVWEALLDIPYGKTETYLGLSQKLGNVKAIRAVAAANGANAISIIVPCHRIVGSDGSLTGYAGGLEAKRKLLQLERARLPSVHPLLF